MDDARPSGREQESGGSAPTAWPDAVATALPQVARQIVRLRDRVVVVELPARLVEDEAARRALAGSLATGRALGVRFVLVSDAPLSATTGRFVAEIAAHGERLVTLPALGILTVHAIPGAPPLAIVQPTLIVQLASLGSIPLLIPPVTDPTGAELAFDLPLLGAALARFCDAAARVVFGERPAVTAPAKAGELPAPPTLHADPAAPERLLVDLLAPTP